MLSLTTPGAIECVCDQYVISRRRHLMRPEIQKENIKLNEK